MNLKGFREITKGLDDEIEIKIIQDDGEVYDLEHVGLEKSIHTYYISYGGDKGEEVTTQLTLRPAVNRER